VRLHGMDNNISVTTIPNLGLENLYKDENNGFHRSFRFYKW